jgi:putative polyketide hydroxylase/tetracenomycin A2 monooxygenase-dioxygenase
VSTLDLIGRDFVLLAAAGTPWCEHIHRLAVSASGLRCLAFGSHELPDAAGLWPSAFGVGPEGAVLVRPDCFVAWRSQGLPHDPGKALLEALERLGLRGPVLALDGAEVDRAKSPGQ